MSGGSWGYMHTRDGEELIHRTDELDRMAERFIELGHEDVAREVLELSLTVKAYRVRTDVLVKRLAIPLRSLDRLDSADDTVAQLAEACDRWRAGL